MKIALGIAVAALSVTGLSACATMDEDYYASSSDVPTKQVVDAQRVARIERINRLQGSRLIWVNLPTKRVSTDSSNDD